MATVDLKYAVRRLVNRPWFTLLTVLVLSGGLGISLYTFAVLYTMIYRELPLPDGGSIVRIGTGEWPNLEPLDAFELAQLRADAKTIGELGAYRTASRSLVGEGEAGSSRKIRSIEADWKIFEFGRTPPLLGRGFVRDDTDGESVAVLSYEIWQSVFTGDPDILGEVVRINGRPTRVVGVMPEGYAFPVDAQMWLPLTEQTLDPPGYAGTALHAYARLRPGVSARAAEAELTPRLQSLRQQRPGPDEQRLASVSVMSFQEESWGFLGTVVFGVLNLLALTILLMASVNVGNLLLARTNERIREVGVRIALGARRWQLIVQMMLENTILCGMGGVIAVLVAGRALEATGDFMEMSLGAVPFWWTWSLDRDVVAAAGTLLLLTVLVVSALPVLWLSRADPNVLLRDATRTRGLRISRISLEMVTLQVALVSAVMVIGGTVAVIAQRAAGFDFGMSTADLLIMDVEPPAESYVTADERISFYERLLVELRASSGIDAAVIMQPAGLARFTVEDTEYASPDDRPGATLVVLSETPSPLGPTLIAGRVPDSRDGATGIKTAVISESLARAYWPNDSPLDQRINVFVDDSDAEERLVVGVVGDVRYDPLGMSPTGLAAIYVPLPQFAPPSARVVVRHLGDESLARNAVFEALARVDPAVPPGDVRGYTAALEQTTRFARTITKLFVGCGAFAILIAVTGIFGMSSNAVVLRRLEIGMRRALGASNGQVVSLFLAGGIRQLAKGLAESGLLCVGILLVIQRGFSVGFGTLALIGLSAVLVVSASVLLAIHLSVRGVIRLEPAAALRHG